MRFVPVKEIDCLICANQLDSNTDPTDNAKIQVFDTTNLPEDVWILSFFFDSENNSAKENENTNKVADNVRKYCCSICLNKVAVVGQIYSQIKKLQERLEDLKLNFEIEFKNSFTRASPRISIPTNPGDWDLKNRLRYRLAVDLGFISQDDLTGSNVENPTEFVGIHSADLHHSNDYSSVTGGDFKDTAECFGIHPADFLYHKNDNPTTRCLLPVATGRDDEEIKSFVGNHPADLLHHNDDSPATGRDNKETKVSGGLYYDDLPYPIDESPVAGSPAEVEVLSLKSGLSTTDRWIDEEERLKQLYGLKDAVISVKRLPKALLSNLPVNLRALRLGRTSKLKSKHFSLACYGSSVDKTSQVIIKRRRYQRKAFKCIFKDCPAKTNYATEVERDWHVRVCHGVKTNKSSSAPGSVDSGEQAEPPTQTEKSDDEDPPEGLKPKFFCLLPNCPRKRCFQTKAQMEAHQLAVHQGITQPHVCDTCKKIFKKKYMLLAHIRTVHQRYRRFYCELCGQGCISNQDLINHMTIHTGEKNFQCKKCDKLFKTQHTLEYHEKYVHQKLKPFGCDRCGKFYATSTKLKIHIKTIHEVELNHVCSLCGKGFPVREYLYMHMRNTHHTTLSGKPYPFSASKSKLAGQNDEAEDFQISGADSGTQPATGFGQSSTGHVTRGSSESSMGSTSDTVCVPDVSSMGKFERPQLPAPYTHVLPQTMTMPNLTNFQPEPHTTTPPTTYIQPQNG